MTSLFFLSCSEYMGAKNGGQLVPAQAGTAESSAVGGRVDGVVAHNRLNLFLDLRGQLIDDL
jgi:hypothetical protein